MTSHCAGTVQMREESGKGKESEKRCDLRRQQKIERGGSSDARWKTVPQTNWVSRLPLCSHLSWASLLDRLKLFITFLTQSKQVFLGRPLHLVS